MNKRMIVLVGHNPYTEFVSSAICPGSGAGLFVVAPRTSSEPARQIPAFFDIL